MVYRWTRLSDLLVWLQDHPQFQFALLNREEALTNALTSKAIPIRGRERYKSEFARIESQLSIRSKIYILGNLVETSNGTFENVEADLSSTQRWLLENGVDSNVHVLGEIASSPSSKAIQDLKDYLSIQEDYPQRIKREFFDQLRVGEILRLGDRYRTLSFRAFERAWAESAPEAWTKAGFRSGRTRKIKSPR